MPGAATLHLHIRFGFATDILRCGRHGQGPTPRPCSMRAEIDAWRPRAFGCFRRCLPLTREKNSWTPAHELARKEKTCRAESSRIEVYDFRVDEVCRGLAKFSIRMRGRRLYFVRWPRYGRGAGMRAHLAEIIRTAVGDSRSTGSETRRSSSRRRGRQSRAIRHPLERLLPDCRGATVPSSRQTRAPRPKFTLQLAQIQPGRVSHCARRDGGINSGNGARTPPRLSASKIA